MKINFDYFQIQKCYKQLQRKKYIKNGVICLVSIFPSWVIVRKFYNFVLSSARNLSQLKQITYMHLKVLILLLEKIVWFIGVWATVQEILAIKILKMLNLQKFNEILQLQTLISPKQ